jgi:hypothetical protein
LTQEPIELILLRHWASCIETPVWIMDEGGTLLFYNEPAELILGQRFDEAGAIQAAELAAMFQTKNLDGSPLANDALPVVAALQNRVPSHGQIRFKPGDRDWRDIEITALPIEGQGGRNLGVMAMFWELSS